MGGVVGGFAGGHVVSTGNKFYYLFLCWSSAVVW